MSTAVLWLRRDLRLHDLPALTAAHEAGTDVLPLFVLDPRLLSEAGPARLHSLRWALDQAQREYDGALVIRHGDPAKVVPAVVEEAGAGSVHVSGESTPYGRARGRRVREALGETPMRATGTPYAVSPGQVRNKQGDPYRVFTPFSRAWRDHGWAPPEPVPSDLRPCRRVESEGLGPLDDAIGDHAPGTPGDDVPALERWRDFLDADLAEYDIQRDRADLDRTSRMSEHLKYGSIHPRTMLADIAAHPAGNGSGATTFVTELCWREFYADVLWHHPRSAWHDLRDTLAGLAYDDPDTDGAAAEALDAWRTGTTGYPFVDAGMRQLLAEGWVHNRVRMVVASFLTKDLHVWWPHGARHFLRHLRDGDVASNNHGWQWVAGTGTDAAPYFRVFNPITQGRKFDPHGDYVRRYVPELAHVPGGSVHEPWTVDGGYDHDYPRRLVDHAQERREALARYERAKA